MVEKGAGLDVEEEDGSWDGVSGVPTGGPSTAIDASPSRSNCSVTASGSMITPSESCWKMRLTAMIPAAPVSADRSAPT